MFNGAGSNQWIKMAGIVLLAVGILWLGSGHCSGRSPMAIFGGFGGGSGSGVSAVLVDDRQEVAIDLKARGYEPIVVQKGVPVRFNIRAEESQINGCNGTVVIPDYNVQTALKPGDNIIEFTPTETGTIPYSCWMGMINSSIQVVEALDVEKP